MKVNLAGFNVDKRMIDDGELLINRHALLGSPEITFTPETISAAYARISRSKKDVDQLRDDAIFD